MVNDIFNRIFRDCVLNEKVFRNSSYAPSVRRVIAVSGAAALGKTTLCRNLASYLNGEGISSVHVELDGFLRDREFRKRHGLRGYDPRATDLGALVSSLTRLIYQGESIQIPRYNHETGSKDGSVELSPVEVVILDGIMSMHYEVREKFPNYRIFLQAEDLVMRGLRLLTDMRERGYTVFDALAHADDESRSYDRWIHHQIETADLLLAVGQNWEIQISKEARGPHNSEPQADSYVAA